MAGGGQLKPIQYTVLSFFMHSNRPGSLNGYFLFLSNSIILIYLVIPVNLLFS